jgi:hypothetical protein
MQTFEAGELLRTLMVRFDYGDMLLEGIQQVIKEERIETGYVTGGIGTFDRCRMHMITTTGFPSKDKIVEMEGPIELLTLQGFIASGEPHIHMTVSDTEQAYGGHLEPGSRVLYLGEVRIDVLSERGFVRRPHPERKTAQLQKDVGH